MRNKNIELWISLFIIAVISLLYLYVIQTSDIPAASSLFGHLLGVIGFILMLMTEVLYSIRKRYQYARWGKLQHWLSFHIITGITGPYLVLLHTSWKFNGLAGILMLLTIIIVISGFIGRYFYTAIPRSADGLILDDQQVSSLILSTKVSIQDWSTTYPELNKQVETIHTMAENGISFARIQKELQRTIKNNQQDHEPISELRDLIKKQIKQKSQLRNLARSRRLLAVWHTFHVPLGISLFFLALIHIAATLYYATFLH